MNGLRIKMEQLITTEVGGSSNYTIATGVKKIIEAIITNEHQELYDRFVSKLKGVIDPNLEVNKQLEN